MAIQTNALGSGALLLPTGFNYKQAMTGSTPGLTIGFMVRVPSSGMTSNGAYRFGLYDQNADGAFTGGVETQLLIDGDNASRANRLRPSFASAQGTSNQVAGPAGSPTFFASHPQMVPGTGYLFLFGVRNVGTSGSPDWRVFWSGGPMGGSATSEVLAQGTNFATWLSTAGVLIGQWFADQGSSGFRSPSGAALENVAVIWHDIPWDTGNNRPDHTVVNALLAGTATYESASFLNGGTIKDWRKLANTTDLADYGSDGRAAATIRGTLVDATAIGTGLWLGASSISITEPLSGWVYGGRGTRQLSFSGTYTGPVTSLQYRIERNTGTVASPVWTLVSGYDWQSAGGSFGGGNWSFTMATALPVGANYRLRVRDSANFATEAITANRWHVGKAVLVHGQSQMERAEVLGRGIRAPIANMAASVLRIANTNKSAGGSGNPFVQPVIDLSDLTTAGATGGGFMAMANADWEATGEPSMYIDMTVEGTALAAWIANDPYGNFFYRGDNASLPTVSSANGSGIMTMMALAAGRYRDVDIFNWGTSDSSDPAGWASRMATYRGFVNTYFSSSSASTPMIIYPYPRSCGGSTWPAPLTLRNNQRAYALATANTVYGCDILDIVMDVDGGNHPRANASDVGSQIREIAGEGSQRMGLTMGRVLARWGSGGSVSLGAPVMSAAVFTSGARNIIEIECGTTLRTENSAALAQLFTVSTDSGTTFSSSGFTASLVGTKVRLTKDSGSWPTGTTRVDYCREMPFQSPRENTEAAAATLLDGLVYGPVQTWRDGRGMHLQPIGATGLTVAESNVVAPVPASVALVAGTVSAVNVLNTVPVAASVAVVAGSVNLFTGAPLVPVAARIGIVAGTAAASVELITAPQAATVALVAGNPAAQFVQLEDPNLAPVTVAEAKAHLREDSDDNDVLIASLIRAAADYIEAQTGIVCRARDVLAYVDTFGPRLTLHKRPVNSVATIAYDADDGTEKTLTTWRVREFAGRPVIVPAYDEQFPQTEDIKGAVRVTYNAGYNTNDDISASVKQAALLLVGHWFANREAVVSGNVSDEIAFTVNALLSAHKRGHVG